MTTRLQRWKTIGAVAGFMWGAIACRAIVGIEDITDNGGGDGGLSDRSMTTDGPTHDAKADSHHPSDAKADVVTTDTGTHDAGHDAGVDAHVRSPLFFAWVTSIDGGTPDGAVAVASDAGFTSYLQPYVVYPLEDGSAPVPLGCPFAIRGLSSGSGSQLPPDPVPETIAAARATATTPGAFVVVEAPQTGQQNESFIVLLSPGATACAAGGSPNALTTPFAGEYAIHAAVSPTADRVAYYQTLVSDAGLYTAIALRVVVVDGGAEIPYRKFPVGFTALGTIDAGPLPVVAAAWDPVIGDFGWVENSDAGQRIVEGVAATPFCPEGTISIPGTPVLAVGFGKSASLQYALVESAIPDAGVHTTWIERACGDPEQPFPTSAGSYGDFAISPDGTLAVLVGPPGSDAGPILDAAAGSALWVATTSPVSGHFATTLCREPGDASGVASPAWVDSKHIVWNEGATSGPNFSPIDPSRSWVDLNLGNEPFTIMIADWSDAGCTNVRSVRTPTQGPAGTAMLPASSDSLTALLLQAVTCSVTEPGLGGRSSGLAVAGILVVAGALFRRRREGDQGSHEP